MEKYNSGKNTTADLDVRIITNGNGIILALRDNGTVFNPLEYLPEEINKFQVDGIVLLKALVKNITYNRVLSFNRVLSLNQTIIEL